MQQRLMASEGQKDKRNKIELQQDCIISWSCYTHISHDAECIPLLLYLHLGNKKIKISE